MVFIYICHITYKRTRSGLGRLPHLAPRAASQDGNSVYLNCKSGPKLSLVTFAKCVLARSPVKYNPNDKQLWNGSSQVSQAHVNARRALGDNLIAAIGGEQ